MKNYIELALRTESKESNDRLLHATLGLTTECVEVLLSTSEVNLKEELGDICWYLAIICDLFDLTFEELVLLADQSRIKDDPVKAMVYAVGEINNLQKRAIFYKRDLDPVVFCKHAGTILGAILTNEDEISLDDLQQANIAKLTRRYPGGFTQEAEAVRADLS